MTTEYLVWEQAVLRVLEDAGEPLHYTEIGNRIAQKRSISIGFCMTTRRTH